MSTVQSSRTESIRQATNDPRLPQTTQHAYGGEKDIHRQTAAPVARVAYVVNSIKAGFRKLGAGVLADSVHGATKRRTNAYAGATPATGQRKVGGNVLGAKRKAKGLENLSLFELHLSSLPRVDPVDRTMNWLFHQHQPCSRRRREEGGGGRVKHDQNDVRQGIDNLLMEKMSTFTKQETLKQYSDPESSSWQQVLPVGSSPYETSLSYYESARGTGGRGTPPLREDGQPRLDDLFRQFQVRQEREARLKLAGQHKLQPIPTVPGYLAGVSHDLLPLTAQQTPLIHKNSSHYNQGHTHQCEWGQCYIRFLSSKDLLSHIQGEHLSRLPTSVKDRTTGQRLLMCHWRGCGDGGRSYMARYKLLMHIKIAHVNSQQRRSDSHTTFSRNRQRL